MHVAQVVVGLTGHLHLLIWEVPTVGEVLLLAQPNLLSPLFKLNLILVDEHISVVCSAIFVRDNEVELLLIYIS